MRLELLLFLFLLFFILLILKANAGIFLEGKSLVAEAEDLCAFEIEINFDPEKTRIYNVTIEQPFLGDYGLEKGTLKLVGFSVEPLKGKITLAKIEFDGELKISYAILYDSEGRESFLVGKESTILTPTPVPNFIQTPIPTFIPVPTTPILTPQAITTPSQVPTLLTPTSTPESISESIETNLTPAIPINSVIISPTVPTTPVGKLPIPGFEVILSLVALVIVGYLLKKR